ncbi:MULTISPECIES: DNA polymerase III subunit chi [Testudinibacter]|uniref:DNA polymerase III chi subunit n=1 Tax=Testudinibacter aquarius TaxID=1524974 RepID=A0A4R3Y8H2_9PAST|nr:MULTISPECIES: DNA polymerase III subunit chi [Testudinibacter]TNG95181.1 DNA polymerase III subunit chi [Pasteurellaceae bacterium UScroc12]TNG96218.1 DNA polymerase III subunit chi [Pasteurellaceae bacterium USgator41]TNH01617.1 DNA polymerase III subunit chi [Pasteurellaceae bacterium UScroc31]TNH02945.1 DNA polymerase III subunit chi [Pasteurellaceae bacterium USgator11]TNH05036.1 DNA polymerase III subunit chi [Pasteurellaceae bacterium Phil31]TNH06544.1 DNA polymerase III subunit chi 
MKQAQFYLLQAEKADSELNAQEALSCDLAADAWRLGKRVLIACETEQQALLLDEALWQRDPEQFVPHNLSGEITTYATPIEISWLGKRNSQRRDLLISLQSAVPDFANSFNQVIDFVPVEEQAKIQARERYKQYRQLGFELTTQQVS